MPLTIIQQGDQFLFEFQVAEDGQSLSPSDIDDLIVKIGTTTKRLSEGEILYADGSWYFPIDQDESIKWSGTVKCQVKRKRGNEILSSPVHTIDVEQSIIKEKM